MNKLSARKMWLLLIVGLLGTVILISPGLAQSERNVSVDFKDTPIRAALETLFRGTGYSYTIDPGEARPVTLSLRDVPFLSALSAVVRSAGLAYKVQDGVYAVGPKEALSPAPAPTYQPPAAVTEVELPPAEVRLEKVPLNFADAFDIADIFGSQVIMSRMSSMVGSGSYGYGFGSQGNSGFGMPGFSNSYGYGGYGGNTGGIRNSFSNRGSYGGLY